MKSKCMSSLIPWIVSATLALGLSLMPSLGNPRLLAPASAQVPPYNTPFLTDEQLQNSASMTADQIREFLSTHGSYFRQPVVDVDGVTFDAAQVIAQAATHYPIHINPQVVLTTLQKESSGVTRTTRPSDVTMGFLMGCLADHALPEPPYTARGQLWCATEKFYAYHQELINNGETRSGWRVGVAKRTQDGVFVTPATRAVAGQFTYTPYVGTHPDEGWNGQPVCGPNHNQPCGGVYLFYYWWGRFGFGGTPSRQLDLAFVIDTTGSMWDDIAAVKNAATYIVNTIMDTIPDTRVALVDFSDFPVYPYGAPSDHAYRDDLAFTSDRAAAIAAINGLTLGNGQDWPEDDYCAVTHAINADTCAGYGDPTSIGTWRNIPAKFIILMTDAPPHDPEPFTGFTEASVASAAQNADPIVVDVVAIGGNNPLLAQLAADTGGSVFNAPTANEVVAAIMEAIGTIAQTPIPDAGGPGGYYVGVVGQAITFDGGLSYDPDGAIVLYEWDFESDGVFDLSSPDFTAIHIYTSEFTGTVTLRVIDNDGHTAMDTAPVTVATSPPSILNGRMNGGGIVMSGGVRVTHGFELHCDTSLAPNNLEVNWGSRRFHLENLTSATCTDDPAIAPDPPAAPFDTYQGTGTGRYNGVSGATIEWTFTDAGEPGKNDFVQIVVTDASGTVVLSVSGYLGGGNHEALEDLEEDIISKW